MELQKNKITQMLLNGYTYSYIQRLTRSDFCKIPNLGRKSMLELLDILKKYNLFLGMNVYIKHNKR